MPGYVMHVTFAKLVGEKLGIKLSNRYLASSLIPDSCAHYYDTDKTIGHFAKRFNDLFKDPDLDLFLSKYGEFLNDEAGLGIYSHLYLDKYFCIEFLYDVFDISNGIMTNKKTGKKYKIWQEFFAKNGVYKEYSAMNKMFIEDYNLDMYSLNFNLKKLPPIDEYDYARLLTFKKRVIGFLKEDGKYTGAYIEYEQIKEFLENLSVRFVNDIIEMRKNNKK